MKKEFNKYFSRKKSFGEVELFKHMHNYLSKKYNCVFIDETHQQYVEFTSKSTKCIKKREMSDLWIIAFSPKKRKIKMTFLQAKFERKKRIVIPFSFKGDYYQYDLLANRPLIKDLSKFKFPNNILSAAISDSVGSFGIFYLDIHNQIDFAFSIASDLICKNNANCKTKNRTFYFRNINLNSFEIRIDKFFNLELRSTLNMDIFENALISMLIGTPIEKEKSLISFLKKYFAGISNTITRDFINLLNILDDTNFENDVIKEGFLNILLINVDE